MLLTDVLRPSRPLGTWENTFPFLAEAEVDLLSLAARSILVDTNASFLYPPAVNISLLLTLSEIPCLGLSFVQKCFLLSLASCLRKSLSRDFLKQLASEDRKSVV